MVLRCAHLPDLIKQLPVAIAILDRDLRYLCVSQRWLKEYGLSDQNLIGRSHYELFPNLPDTWKRLHQDCLTFASSACIEDEIDLPNGSKAWIKSEISAWFDASGSIEGLMLAREDITLQKQATIVLQTAKTQLEDQINQRTLQLKQTVAQLEREIAERHAAEEQLKCSEQQYRNLVETSQDMIFVMNQEGKYTFANAAARRIYALEPEELINQPFVNFLPSERIESEFEVFKHVLQGRSLFQYESIVLNRDQQTVQISVNAIPLFGSDGSFQGIYGTISDISERKQAEIQLRQQADALTIALSELKQAQAQLVQTEKMTGLGQLVAGIAHELNNPVSFIFGNLVHVQNYTQDLLHLIEFYQKRCPNPEFDATTSEIDLAFIRQDTPRILASMRTGAQRIQSIVTALRTFSRIDEAELKTVNVHDGLESTLLMLQHRISENRIEIIKNYETLPEIECYAGQLNQVFMNLLTNAIDAVVQRFDCAALKGTGATIQIETAMIGHDRIQVSISDNGIGIPVEHRSRVFEPFFTTKPVGKGTGLGLSICYQIVEQHSGVLRCHSIPGEGSTFIVEISVRHAA